jgi:hypothetical protein
MYLVGFPLLLIPLAIYNILVFLLGLGFDDTVFSVSLMSGAVLGVTTGDLLIILSILLLFVEILKSARFGARSFVDHFLSLVVFAAAVAQFLMVPKAATSTFLLLLAVCAVDVVGGIAIALGARATSRRRPVESAEPPAPAAPPEPAAQ